MKRLFCYLFIGITLTIFAPNATTAQTLVTAGRLNEVFLKTDLATNLHDPWEITYGPDDSLWVTESKSYTVFKIARTGGAKRTILNLATYANATFRRQFNRSANPAGFSWPQGGLMGMAIHPQFLSGKPYVYLAEVYSFTGQVADSMGCIFVNKLVRWTYDFTTFQLGSPVAICDTLPGSSDHNSGRMIIAPVGGVNYLFYAQGDMGAGQFGNKYRTNKAQFQNSYEGKILRFNLEPDGDAGALDQWIPNDNPYNIPTPPATPTTQSAVWAMGIRNNQGFAYAKINGKDYLYGASHGPYSDDEINVIDSLKNYGHPYVIGYSTDGNYNGSRAGAPPRTSPALSAGASTLPLIGNEATNAAAYGNKYRDPIFAGYGKQTAAYINNLYVNNPANSGWPSEAWSGMDIDTGNIIPGFKYSLVLGGLKWGRIVRLKLNYKLYNGDSIDHSNSDTMTYFQGQNRFRDLALSPDNKFYQKTYYVITDSSNTTSGPSGANPMPVDCTGCLQSYTFEGYYNNTSNNKSTIPTSIPITTSTTVNSCITATPLIINSINDTMWVPITGPDGNIVGELKAGGNVLDTVVTSFYLNSGTMREDGYKRLYLDRNFTITPKNQPAAGKPATIRLYITNAEFNAMKTATNSSGQASGVNIPTDLRIFKNTDACGAMTNSPISINPTYAEAFGAGGYVLQFSVTSFSSFYITSANMIILPLQLTSFNGVAQNNAALLDWVTDNENNIGHFDVERSTDGRTFEKVGVVAAVGNTKTSTKYNFTDNDAAKQSSSLVYYRLKMVDQTGTYSYSKIINVQFNPSTFSVFVYPVPINDVMNLKVSLERTDNIHIQVTDMQGHVVYSQNQIVSNGTTELKIDSRLWSSQTYSVQVTSNDNQMVVTKKVIKM